MVHIETGMRRGIRMYVVVANGKLIEAFEGRVEAIRCARDYADAHGLRFPWAELVSLPRKEA